MMHSARIALSLSSPGRLRANVLDLQGRVVREVIDQDRPAGPCEIMFDGLDDERRPLRSGVYFLRISPSSVLTTKAFVVAR
jgi:hypothetical protein